MQAFSSAVEVLRGAKKAGDANRFCYSVLSLADATVQASNGLAIVPDMYVHDLPGDSIIVAVSCAGVANTPNPVLLAKLSYLACQKHEIWAISSGVVRPAKAG